MVFATERRQLVFEYRVRWQRLGLPKRRSIWQTLSAASREVDRQRDAHEDMDWLIREDGTDDRPPRIVWGPVIEHREVGDWIPVLPGRDSVPFKE